MAQKIADRFRKRANALMRVRGLTITELAEKVGTSRPGMSRILSGDEQVSLERAERVAIALGITLPELLAENSLNVA